MLPGDDCRALHCHTALLMSSRRQCCWCDLIRGAHLTISRCWPRSAATCSVVASFSSSTSMLMMEKRPADFRFPVPKLVFQPVKCKISKKTRLAWCSDRKGLPVCGSVL